MKRALLSFVTAGALLGLFVGFQNMDFVDTSEYRRGPLKLSLMGETHCPSNFRRIYVSTSGNDNEKGNTPSQAIRTLWRAKGQSQTYAKSKPHGICILLKGGDIFSPDKYFTLKGSTQTDGIDGDLRLRPDYNRAAFLWDLNVPLILSNYGTGRPILRGPSQFISIKDKSGVKRSSILVQMAVVVAAPSTHPVLIENLQIENWEMQAISIFKARNVTIRNNYIRNIGTLFFPQEEYLILRHPANAKSHETMPIYTGGVILVKSSRDVIIHHNYLKNMHNREDAYMTLGDLHAFYIQKSQYVELRHNFVKATSGPPLKLDGNTNKVIAFRNRFEGAAPGDSYKDVMDQVGFIRIPCKDSVTSCAKDILIKQNVFAYPYCKEKSGCPGETASLYSGAYFETFASACAARCWSPKSVSNSSYCAKSCRGIVLEQNSYLESR